MNENRIITVKNAEGDPDTQAEIIIQNKIDYIPKVSVIIPVYNVEEYLRECLDSVVNQTLKEIEIICVDDGSTDNSLEILKEYAQKDNRITVIKQENLYAGVARNAGLSQAKGEYVHFLDSDDFFELNMLEEMLLNANKEKVDIVICRARRYINNSYENINWTVRNNYLENNRFSCKSSKISDIIYQAIVGYPWDKLFSHKLIKRLKVYFSSTHHHNDTSFVYTALAGAENIFFIDKIFINWRFNPVSVSKQIGKNVDDFMTSINDLYGNLCRLKLYEHVKKSFLNYVVHICVFTYKKHGETQSLKRTIQELGEKYLKNFQYSDCYNDAEFSTMQNIIKHTHIPLVLASDNNYALPMMVTMESALQTAQPNTIYDFHLLVSEDFAQENKDKIQSIINRYPKSSVNFLTMGKQYDDAGISIKHITTATYYRLDIPNLLPKINKCIYLDVDLIVKEDLSQLFQTNVEDKYIAGVLAACYYSSEEKIRIKEKELGIPLDQYVNAGVLLINLAKMRKDNMVKKFATLLPKNFSSQDQDILNTACYGKIKILPFKYNAMTKYKFSLPQSYNNISGVKRCYTKEEWNDAIKHPVIIHYADKLKPWVDACSESSKDWWQVVEKMEDSLNIYRKYITGISKKCFEHYLITNKVFSNNNNISKSQQVNTPLLFKDIGFGCNTWCKPKTITGNNIKSYTYDLSDNIYARYVSWDPIKEGSCDIEIKRLFAVEKRSKKIVEFPINKIVSSGKIKGNKVEFRNQKGCWIGCTIEGAYESFTIEAKIKVLT